MPEAMMTPVTMTPAIERECHGCGLFQAVPPLAPGVTAECERCGTFLRRGRTSPVERPLAYSLAALAFFLLAATLPFMTVSAAGRNSANTMLTGPEQLEITGYPSLAVVVLAFSVVMPAVKIGIMLLVLLGLQTANPPRWLPRAWGWVEVISPWAMIEVFLLGVFVAYTRLTAIAHVDIGPALYALGACMLAMVAADNSRDREAVWEALEARGLTAGTTPHGRVKLGCDTCRLVSHGEEGQPCPRCGSALHRRKHDSLPRTTALLLAAALFYIPANLYPVLNLTRLGRGGPSTIVGGVIELVQAGMLPLALLVLFASVIVPLLKLGSLTWMVWQTRHGSADRLRFRTRLFRAVDFIGRWSMIDVFMISILTALVRLGFLATVVPEVGAVAFASVVIITMFAAGTFDPRLMWDAAELPQPQALPQAA